MLTGDLLRATVQRGTVLPRWVDPDEPGLLALAQDLIAIHLAHVGKSRGELETALEARARSGDRVRLERGLSKLLDDRSEFEAPDTVDPEVARAEVFTRAAVARAAGSFDRAAVLVEAATALGVSSPQAVEDALEGDRRPRERLLSIDAPDPRALLVRYNVALGQAVLLRATRVRVELEAPPARIRHVVRAIKFRELLFRATQPEKAGLILELDGPLSLFESSTKYGLKLAEVLPAILLCERFALDAELGWGKKRLRKSFRLSHEDLGRGGRTWLKSPIPDPGAAPPVELDAFVRRFKEIAPAWDVDDDVPVLAIGEGDDRDAIVPDLRFVHRKTKKEGWLELLTHARRGSVPRRLEMLERHAPPGLVVAVAQGLAKGERLPPSILTFRQMPLAGEVLARLDESLVTRAMTALRSKPRGSKLKS